MMENLVRVLLIVVLLYVGFLFLKSYKPDWFSMQKEGFAKKKQPLAPAPMPVEKPVEPAARVVAPGGPATPSAEAPAAPPTRLPEETARDPYDEVQGRVPLEDSLRHPENSFAPGIRNTGTELAAAAGTASHEASGEQQTFSPEFSQNGGEFMPGILAASDGGDEYALV